jgi:magnesium transporter
MKDDPATAHPQRRDSHRVPKDHAHPGHPETAAQHLARKIPRGLPEDTVRHAIAALAGSTFEAADTLHVVDGEGVLLGLIPLCEVLRAQPDRPLADVMTKPFPVVWLDTDQEIVASMALKHGVSSVPVVDEAGRLLGSVPPLALLQVLRHEHVEDLHRLAGIRRETKHARAALEAPPMRRALDRLPWLIVGLAGSVLAAMLMARFHTLLEARIAVAFFIPGIVYLADAIGTQTEAIAVRGISMSELPWRRLVWGEIKTGALLGFVLAALSFLGVLAVLQDFRLALSVAITVLSAGVTATAVGSGFPTLLAHLGRDPAFGSGPLGTIIQDILTLVIYFVVVSLLL